MKTVEISRVADIPSEIIWDELIELKKEKPIVVSMGNVAASGGYYLSTVADKVFANDFTITGSIGVFAMVPNISELSKRIGVNAEQVETNKNSIFYTPFEKPTQQFRSNVKKSIENIYEMFKKRVSDGRNISMDEVEALAQGRVWSGEQALKNGLVDTEGDIKDAINAGVKAIHLEKPICNSVKQLEELFSLVKNNDISLTYGTIRRYFDIYNKQRYTYTHSYSVRC